MYSPQYDQWTLLSSLFAPAEPISILKRHSYQYQLNSKRLLNQKTAKSVNER